ncbi:hypothetical protein [Flavobacterium sp.]|uniref:hypothetical protein n=1 Tax=Flavobacterium sp. TaxID=239 RepID=UPI0035297E7B
MKKCYFLFSLLLCFVANAQIVNIPDANFKAKLLSASSNNQVASSSLVFVNSEWSPPDYCKIDINNDGEIQVSEALNIKFLQLQGVDITDLTGLEAFINLEYFSHGSSYLNPSLNSINVSQNTLLKVLRIGNNNFSSLDVSNNINLLELYCNSNNLASLDISNNPLLKKLYCYNNNISILDFSNNPNLSYLQCGENSLTSIDVSICPLLTFLSCYFNNDLLSINVKNNNPGLILSFSGTPNLQYICADEGDIAMIQQKINDYGYTTCHVNSYCTFTPGGTFYDVQGNIYLDIDNNGCDTTDPTLPNMRATIVSGTSNSTLITSNQLSSYYIPVGAGNHTITYDFLNSNYFTISPSSITVDFPTQASPFMQDICVTPNGQHSDVEVTILPLNAARPGF